MAVAKQSENLGQRSEGLLIGRNGIARISAARHDDGAPPLAWRRNARIIETDIPARLDRLRWSGFHTLVVLALGITWILDGLEVTLAGALSGALKESPTLQFTNVDIGIANSAYLAGAVLGALVLRLADRPDRAQEAVLHHARGLSRCDRGDRAVVESGELRAVSFSHRRRHRRRIHGDQFDDPGTGAGALSRLDRSRHQRQLLDRRRDGRGRRASCCSIRPCSIPISAGGWRIFTGAALGLVVFVMRMWIPESPRWLMIHGQPEQAHAIVAEIERRSTGACRTQPQTGACRRSD